MLKQRKNGLNFEVSLHVHSVTSVGVVWAPTDFFLQLNRDSTLKASNSTGAALPNARKRAHCGGRAAPTSPATTSLIVTASRSCVLAHAGEPHGGGVSRREGELL